MNRIAEPAHPLPISTSRAGGYVAIRRRERWVLAAVIAVAAGLRLGLVGGVGLWSDEIFSLATATGHSLEQPAAAARPELGDFVEPDHPVSAKEFSRYVNHQTPLESPARVVRAVLLSDTNPPLYYLLLYGWTFVFGTSDLALRLFSIACALACFPFLIGIARRTGGRAAVFGACVLFAVSPLSIYYSLEGRMYSLLWLCVLATSWVALVMQQRGTSIGLSALWILASTAGFFTHYFFLFPWLAIVGYLALRPGRFSRIYLAICMFVTAALAFPWYINLPDSLARWRVTKDWLKWRPTDFGWFDSLARMVAMFFTGHEKRLWLATRAGNLAPLIVFAVIAAPMVWRMRRRVLAGGRLLLVLIFAAACAGPFAFDFFQGTYTVAWPRYAIAGLPAVYLLAASGLTCFRRRTSMIVLTLLVLAWVPNFVGLQRTRFWWAPIEEISSSLWRNSSPSDLILIHSIPSGAISLARYAPGPAEMASWIQQLGNRHMPGSLNSLVKGRTRVVFIKVHEAGSDTPELDWLRAHATVSRVTPIGLCKIVEFRPSNSKTF